MQQVLFNNFIYIVLVHVGVPHAIRVYHQHRPFIAAVHATRRVDANLAFAAEIERLYFVLGIAANLAGMVIVAASFTRLALIAAEKHMFLIMTHDANQVRKQFNSLYSMLELGTDPLHEQAEISERGERPQFSDYPCQTGKVEQMPVMPTEQRQR